MLLKSHYQSVKHCIVCKTPKDFYIVKDERIEIVFLLKRNSNS